METYAKRMTRSSRDRIFAGVCAGAAHYLGVDPVLVRIGLVAITLMSAGSGIVLYVAAWFLMPLDDARASDQEQTPVRAGKRVMGVILISLGLLGLVLSNILSEHQDSWSIGLGTLGPLFVIAFGVVLFLWKRDADANANTYNSSENAMPQSDAKSAPRRLMRSASNRKIAGVCAGLANHFDVDATLIRIFWIIAALVFGTGFLLYLIMWFVMPLDTDPDLTKPN